jgi:hypothetical protein
MLLEAEVAKQWQGCKSKFRGIVVQFPAKAWDVSLLQTFQTGTGTHPAFCSVLLEDSVHGVMQSKRYLTTHFLLVSKLRKMETVETLPDVALKYKFPFTYLHYTSRST